MNYFTNPINGSKVKPDRLYDERVKADQDLLETEDWDALTLDDENEWFKIYDDKHGGGVIVKKVFEGHNIK